jgi:hypothetical protein
MNYKLFTNLKAFQALIFVLIPVVIMLVNSGTILDSISAYIYAVPMTFGWLLTLAVAIFFYDGFVEPKRWYNMISGLALSGVVLFPCEDYYITHYIFAGVFFAWTTLSIPIFSSNKQRWFKILIALFITFGILGCFLFQWYSIFWAEWIGLLPISVHYILEVLEKID